jgi:hypothetical protein
MPPVTGTLIQGMNVVKGLWWSAIFCTFLVSHSPAQELVDRAVTYCSA